VHESRHEPDLYRLLGVAPTADAAEIARAYRRRVRDVHPDTANPARRSAEGDAPTDLDALQQAYAVLRDPSRRAQYDAVLRDTAHLRTERSRGVRVPVRVRSRPARVEEPLLRAGPVRVEPLPPRRTQPPAGSTQGSVT
jgi:curved DNA-binding protein CbpA